MANTTIPQLPMAIGLTGAEQLEIVQSGVSARTTLNAIAYSGFAPEGGSANVGLFVAASGLPIPSSITAVITSGFSEVGNGAARYIYDPSVDAAYVAANPASSFLTQNNRGWRIDLSQPLTPNDFGAGFTPTADQTAYTALVAAIQASISSEPDGNFDYTTYQNGTAIPPGVYDAGGLTLTGDFQSIRFTAQIPGTVIIRIPSGQYFLTATGRLNEIVVDGITFIGGKGAVLLTYTSANTNLTMNFTRNFFYEYTECAVANNSVDHPYLRAENNIFFGANGVRTIGLAWGGYVDQGAIENNAFLQNAYHIALGPRLSSTMIIRHNDLISWGDATNKTQADIWIKPNSDSSDYGVNSGFGITLSQNKFGNENQNLSAPRILIATESASGINGGSGTGRQNYAPSTSDGAAWVSGLSIVDNVFAASAGVSAPVIQSNISNVRMLYWRRNQFNGSPYPYVFQFLNAPTLDYTNTNSDFEFSAADLSPTGNSPLAFSNYPMAAVRDYANFFPGNAALVDVYPLSDSTALTLLNAAIVPQALTAFVSATVAQAPDPQGGNSYALVTAAANNSGVYVAMSGISSGGQYVFVELNVEKAASRALSAVTVDVYNYTSGVRAVSKVVQLPANGTIGRVLLPVYVPADANPTHWQLRVYPASGYSSGVTDMFITGAWVINTGQGRLGYKKALDQFPLVNRNPSQLGAVAGSPGTQPLGWSTNAAVNGLAGVTVAVNAVGADQYGQYTELTISGTTSHAGNLYQYFDTLNTVSAANGQVFSVFVPIRLTAGSFTGFVSQTGSSSFGGGTGYVVVDVVGTTSGGSTLYENFIQAATPTITYGTYGASNVLIGNASTAFANFALQMQLANSTAISATLRIYTPVIRRVM